MTPKYEKFLKNQQFAVGVPDVQDLNDESVYALAERINEWGIMAVYPAGADCESMWDEPPPREVAFGKLVAMTGAKDTLRGVLVRRNRRKSV